jgi:integrase
MTKQKRQHRLPLNPPAIELLVRLRERSNGSPLVFPGRAGGPHEDLRYAWRRICKVAGITGLRIHDLRHSHASYLAGAGYSLPIIGALLGHVVPATTARYAHLLNDPLQEATNRVGAILAGEPAAAEVLPLRRKGRRS